MRSLRLVFCKKTDCEMSDSHIDPPMLILFSSDNIFSKTEVRSKAGTQARRQASKQAIKQASKQLCKQASERASSRQTCKQASRQSSKHQAAARNSQQQPSKAEPSEAKQTAKQSMPVMSLPEFSSLDNARSNRNVNIPCQKKPAFLVKQNLYAHGITPVAHFPK